MSVRSFLVLGAVAISLLAAGCDGRPRPGAGEGTPTEVAPRTGPAIAVLDFSGGAAAFTLTPAGVMLSTIDYSVKLLAPAIGSRFIGRGQVISAGKSLIVARADAFAVGEHGETLVATGLVTMRVIT